MHGSCRKPHHDSADGLVRADNWIAERQESPTEWPAWLLMTGDQVYVDDVAGPMLRAVHALIARLGWWMSCLRALPSMTAKRCITPRKATTTGKRCCRMSPATRRCVSAFLAA